MPYNFFAESFHIKKLCSSRLSSSKVWFYTENGRFAFFGSLGCLSVNKDVCVVDFLLVLIESFSLGVTAEVLRANMGAKSVISLQRGRLTQNFRYKRSPHQPFFFSEH